MFRVRHSFNEDRIMNEVRLKFSFTEVSCVSRIPVGRRSEVVRFEQGVYSKVRHTPDLV